MKNNNKKLNITSKEQKFLLNKFGIDSIEDIDVSVLKELKENLKELTDSRQKSKVLYKIWDIVICVILANLTNISDWEDIPTFVESKKEFLKKFLKLTGGIPHYITYERVFSIIEPKELEEILNKFISNIIFNVVFEKDIINIDGRVSRGSSRNETNYNEKIGPLNVLSAYSNNYKLCLASEMIEDKTNEIPMIPVILERLKIKDTIITWDALNTQKTNIEAVINKKGDYVVPIKKNHPNFNADLDLYFDEKMQEQIIAGKINTGYLKQEEKSHACFITYEYFQTNDIKWYHEYKEWKGLNTFGMVKKTIIKNGELKIEKRFYISSLDIGINLFAKAIREHWGVENKLHWQLDFTFREDKNTTTNKTALMNLQLINKFCLGILNKVKKYYGDISLKKIRYKLSLDFEEEFVNLLCYLILVR